MTACPTRRQTTRCAIDSYSGKVAPHHQDQDIRIFPYGTEGKAAEPRTGRRMHIDVMPTDGTRDEEVVRLKGLGRDPSTRIIASPNGPGWVTRADPEGNLFCVERSQEHHGPRQSSR